MQIFVNINKVVVLVSLNIVMVILLLKIEKFLYTYFYKTDFNI
jgi:hypothetical protein